MRARHGRGVSRRGHRRTTIETAAITCIAGPEMLRLCWKPEIMADAAHAILTSDARSVTGRFCIDDEVLREAGVTDFSIYRHEGVSEQELMPDFFV